MSRLISGSLSGVSIVALSRPARVVSCLWRRRVDAVIRSLLRLSVRAWRAAVVRLRLVLGLSLRLGIGCLTLLRSHSRLSEGWLREGSLGRVWLWAI
jgi:hypothetical protein